MSVRLLRQVNIIAHTLVLDSTGMWAGIFQYIKRDGHLVKVNKIII